MTGRDGSQQSLTGLSGQTLPVDRVVAVDTTSRDDSVDARPRRARRAASVLDVVPGSTSYPGRGAPRPGAGAGDRSDDEWIWLLHDDSNPAPTALAELLDAAREHPDARDPRPQAARVALAAPPPRGRPDHHRHRAPRDRSRARRVRPGPARRGPRGARGQHRRHARAPLRAGVARRARRGAADLRQRHRLRLARGAGRAPHARRPAGRGLPRRGRAPRHPAHAADRAPHPLPGAARRPPHLAGQRVLARASPGSTSGSSSARCCGSLGFLVVRSVGEALDELAAALSVHGRPRQLLAARRERADLRQGDPADVRRLLAPRWLPYRHGLDFVTDLASAATSQAADVAERRRLAKAEDAPGTGPGVRERDAGPGRRRTTTRTPTSPTPASWPASSPTRSPWCWRSSASCRCSPPARRSARSPAARCPRCRPPRPTGGGCTSRRWHPLGTGTDVPAPAYVLPFALRRDAPARPHRSRRVRPDAARRPGGGVGRVAAAQGRRPPRRPAGAAALAAWCGAR